VTVDFLRSVNVNTQGEEVEVILVDNGCEEDHRALFTSVYPNLVYLRSEENLGFAGGNNLAVKVARGEYLLFLNNDTEITANLIGVLMFELQRDLQIGIISPLIMYYDEPDMIQYAGFTPMNYVTCRNRGIGNMETNSGQYDQESRETGYCHGAAMMCRREDLGSVGLMEEQYFLYYEELDWCEKFRKAGKKIWFTGKTKIYHKESISVGKESMIKTYFMTRNRMLFIRRNTTLFTTILFSIYYVTIVCSSKIISYLVKRRFDLARQVFEGIMWNLTNSKNSHKLGFKIKN
jgi:GT2 family glycosyltransferase